MTATSVRPGRRAPATTSPNSAYPVKSNSVQPFGGAGMTTAQITNILRGLDPGAVAEAGAAYTNLGHELATMAVSLTQHAQTLAQNWTGSAAQAAMTSFQQLHDQTSALAAQAAQTGSALTWLGAEVLPKFQQLGGPDAALSGGGATAAQAQEYIRALSNYLVTANTDLPDQIGGVASPLPATTNGTSRSGTGGMAGLGAAGLGAGVAGGLGVGGPGADGTANSGQAAGSDDAASGLAPGSGGGTGAASAGTAAGTGSAGGTSLPAGGGNVPGADGTASSASPAPAPTVNSLQSAAPVPGSTPGAAPVSAGPAGPAASAGSATGDLGAGAVGALPLIPGLSGAVGGRRRAAASEAADPAAGTPPGSPGAPGAAAPEALPAGPGPAPAMAPLGEVAPLDGGLTGGAAPLPQALNAPGTGAVAAAVPAGEGAGPSVLITDGPGAPGGGDSPGRDGAGGMPMAGGAAGQSEQERLRRVWAYEDQNIWGLPADCVPPVIEGG